MKSYFLIILLSLIPSWGFASSNDLTARVVDVGAGECVAIKIPGDYYMVYDAGNYKDNGESALRAIEEIIPENEEIDLLVLSHSDADHLGGADEILDAYTVKRVLRTGTRRSTATWNAADAAIKAEVKFESCMDINLSYWEYPAGATYRLGETFVTMVSGFGELPDDWDIANNSERNNAGSIVIRVQYKGKSILLCGDAVGRHIGDPDDTCIASEKFMVENSSVIAIDSDVIVAPHHGADNGSSAKFISAVSPDYVIFSAGHAHEHPRSSTAKRYLNAGVKLENIFRTDKGDDEGDDEWNHQSENNQRDQRGDDDVEIRISKNGVVSVDYHN